MKKITTLLVSLLLPVMLLAQNAPLSIKGIPIEGRATVFANKLIQKGFVLEYENIENQANGFIMMKGPFMNRLNASFIIYTTEDTGIKLVAAVLECDTNWTSAESLYWDTVDIYKVKYGEPTSHTEEFVDTINSISTTFKYSALKDGDCNYSSTWVIDETKEIRIQLQFDDKEYKPEIVIGYIPSVERIKQQVYDDI